MSTSKDYVSRFKDNLRATANLLETCSATASELEDVQHQQSKGTLEDLESVLDSNALTLSKWFLTTTTADAASRSVMTQTSYAEQQAAARKELAQNNAADFEELLKIFQNEIRSRKEASKNGLSQVHQRDLESFYRKIVAARKGDPDLITSRLCTMLYEGNVKQLEGDDEEFEFEESISYKCPLTTRPLEAPVRAECGHYFSQAEILKALDDLKKAMLCPVSGCKQHITKSSLVRDPLKDIEVRKGVRDEMTRRNQELNELRRHQSSNQSSFRAS